MLQGFKDHIAHLPLRDHKLVLALSGGVDSMTLADLLMKCDIAFVAAHCNFHLRGAESDGDERFVRDFADAHGLTLYVKDFDTEAYAKEQGISIEMAARDLRYAWFEELRQRLDYDYVVVAHHADDQLETFFINLLRGAGLRGLKGMQALNGTILRPMLETSREEIMRYALDNHLVWREDHTNAETLYLRNKIRHELLPVIDGISKEGRGAILKSIRHLSSENELYRELVKEKLSQLETTGDVADETPVVNTGETPDANLAESPDANLAESPDANLVESPGVNLGEASRSLRSFHTPKGLSEQLLFEYLRDFGFNTDQVHFIHEALNGQPGKCFLSPTHRLVIERDSIELSPRVRSSISASTSDFNQSSDSTPNHSSDSTPNLSSDSTPNHSSVPILSLSPGVSPSLDAQLFACDASFVLDKSPKVAQLDYEKLVFPLKLRKWQAGDRFHPLGMKGSKLLSDFFVDQKMSTRQKEQCHVLTTADDQIVWVVGRRVDDRFKVTATTKSVLKIRLS
ncbi:MAG: tRNA lysidine(34) synthetase TilS [Bacteroidales bacterium]|nr:tRNA lysidine(34) synthetase TilS [Bacteroidales bacterium]